jgi:hypothetical protein
VIEEIRRLMLKSAAETQQGEGAEGSLQEKQGRSNNNKAMGQEDSSKRIVWDPGGFQQS